MLASHCFRFSVVPFRAAAAAAAFLVLNEKFASPFFLHRKYETKRSDCISFSHLQIHYARLSRAGVGSSAYFHGPLTSE
jgi:hypothetical protein